MLLKDYMDMLLVARTSGEYAGRDMVLAVDCSDSGNTQDPEDFAFVGVHIEDLGAGITAKSEDRSYVYEGDSTVRTSVQRTFSISGTRYISDAFQDFCCSEHIKYGTGAEAQRRYVYFHSGTGKGETGTLTIVSLFRNPAEATNVTPRPFSMNLVMRKVLHSATTSGSNPAFLQMA